MQLTFQASAHALAATAVLSLAPPAPAAAQRSNDDVPRILGFDAPRHFAFALDDPFRLSGDLDGNGTVDLIQFIGGAFTPWREMQIWLNEGPLLLRNAGSVFLQANADRLIGSWPAPLGDVTGDGHLDVVLSYFSSVPSDPEGFVVYPGLGDGNFGARILVDAEAGASELLLGDNDGDGQLEIAARHTPGGAWATNHLRWWKWNGSGFDGSAGVSAESVYTLAALDLDQDGLDDLAGVHHEGGSTPELRFFPTVAGEPTLGAGFALHSSMQSGTVGMLVGDLDGNGLLDLLPNSSSGGLNLQAALQTSAGVFSVRPRQHLERSPFTLMGAGELADVDRDGLPDYVAGHLDLQFVRNVGGGVFELATETTTNDSFYGGHVADVNGDSLPDFVMGHSILLGRGHFPSLLVPGTGIGAPHYSGHLLFDDWDDDGDVDWITANATSLLLNDGTGAYPTGTATGLGSTPFLKELVSRGDFDGDLDADFVFNVLINGYFNTAYFEDDGTGVVSFRRWSTGGVELPVGDHPWPATDMDLDGDLDIAGADGWFENTGNRLFTPVPRPYAGAPFKAVDLDTDGDDDLLVQDGSSLALLFNDGTGAFTSQSLPGGTDCELAGFLDLGADGDLDVFALTSASGSGTAGSLELIENRGGTYFLATVLAPPALSAVAPGLDDLDGDGVLDLLLARGSFVVAYLGQPGGLTFEDPIEWYVHDGPKGFFDRDGDGDLDTLTTYTIENLARRGPTTGRIHQYGRTQAGSGAITPVLGVSGPVRTGHTAVLHLRKGLGGAPAMLLFGTERASFPSTTEPSVVQLVGGVYTTLPLVLSGAAGVAGVGTADVAIPIDLASAGTRIFHQAFLFDPGAPEGVSSTNGLEVVVGTRTVLETGPVPVGTFPAR